MFVTILIPHQLKSGGTHVESNKVLDEKMKGFDEYISNEIMENNKQLKLNKQ